MICQGLKCYMFHVGRAKCYPMFPPFLCLFNKKDNDPFTIVITEEYDGRRGMINCSKNPNNSNDIKITIDGAFTWRVGFLFDQTVFHSLLDNQLALKIIFDY